MLQGKIRTVMTDGGLRLTEKTYYENLVEYVMLDDLNPICTLNLPMLVPPRVPLQDDRGILLCYR